VFEVGGIVQELKPDGKTVVIRHEAISNYMEAMTMPLRAKATNELAGLQPGDVVTFRLSVTEEESWIDLVKKARGSDTPATPSPPEPVPPSAPKRINVVEGLSGYTFTNEFGQAVNFRQYEGQAIGLTFFFTRCPLPEFCPRLAKNFASATRKLEALPNAPTNWHFFSISFDTKVDSPAMLRAYARQYNYNSNRWTFLTASPETISTVTRNFGFNYKWDGGTFTHQFMTVVLDANGFWNAGWPIGGDTSDNLVEEMVKAAAAQKTQ
jgi:protein SCO1/2